MNLPPITDSFPALRFARPWQLICPEPFSDPETSIRYDEELLLRVGRGEIGPCICLKTAPQCLVVTRREARMENFTQARTALAAEGWPLVVRCSGGSCVPQGVGMLNLSLIYPRVKGWTLDEGYLLLCEPLRRLLNSYGLNAETGEVPASFCDGRYNLQLGGKKLVGTAQRWAGVNRAQAAVLAHACLLVDLDLHEVTGKLNQLYRLCNNAQQFDPTACTCLRAELPPAPQLAPADFVAEVAQRLAALLSEAFGISNRAASQSLSLTSVQHPPDPAED